jgi:FKBP-type peptidyl-prolyl cis-trans isomerase (trigger factor)
VEKTLRDYRKKANIPGFRPGMVPMGLLKKMYGKSILADEINKMLSDEYFKEVSQNNPKIIPIEKKTIPEELKINLISVKIGKTIIKVKPGTNIAALKARYETRKFV